VVRGQRRFCPADTLAAYFNESTLVLDNTDASMVQQIEQRTPLLWLLTAHLAALYSGVNGQAPAQLVGRINNASEGSVSVATDYGTQPATAAYYLQTKYGAQYWQMTASIRAMQYVPGFPQAHPYPLPGFRWGMR
jgi:recombinational DNA repair protein RecR